jgi:hypothetical protein
MARRSSSPQEVGRRSSDLPPGACCYRSGRRVTSLHSNTRTADRSRAGGRSQATGGRSQRARRSARRLRQCPEAPHYGQARRRPRSVGARGGASKPGTSRRAGPSFDRARRDGPRCPRGSSARSPGPRPIRQRRAGVAPCPAQGAEARRAPAQAPLHAPHLGDTGASGREERALGRRPAWPRRSRAHAARVRARDARRRGRPLVRGNSAPDGPIRPCSRNARSWKRVSARNGWRAGRDSNPRPSGSKPDALSS